MVSRSPPWRCWRAWGPSFRRLVQPRPGFIAALLVTAYILALARADCECGYSAPVAGESGLRVFTDLIETDFERVTNVATNTDWARQAFNLTSQRARGQFGELFAVDNAGSNPAKDSSRRIGPGLNGRPAGLELTVKSTVVDGMVPVAELDSSRTDVLWGSFRVGMRLTATPGTCAAFFWYFNDTQEIDMEFLSKDFNPANNSYPVNLVLQSRAAVEAGYNAQATGDFKKAHLSFNPTEDFHEYRIDFLPGRVVFYADGLMLAEMKGAAVPSHGGHLILQHWSNGNPLWSGGPPVSDSVMAVSYVKAYFNSSTQVRQNDWAARCKDPAVPGAVCRIPDEVDVRNPALFSTMTNMTNNQTISSLPGPTEGRPDGGAVGNSAPGWLLAFSIPLMVGLWVCGPL